MASTKKYCEKSITLYSEENVDTGVPEGVSAYNVPLYESPKCCQLFSAKIKGIKGNEYHSSFTIVFVGDENKETTLQVMGQPQIGPNEEGLPLAIVGGTGCFKFAQGIVRRHKMKDDSNDKIQVIKYDIEAYMLDPSKL